MSKAEKINSLRSRVDICFAFAKSRVANKPAQSLDPERISRTSLVHKNIVLFMAWILSAFLQFHNAYGYSYDTDPDHTVIYDYFLSSDKAKQTCFSFATGLGYSTSYCGVSGSPTKWSAGNLGTPIPCGGGVAPRCHFYMGIFYFPENNYYIEFPQNDPDLGAPQSCPAKGTFVNNPINARTGNKVDVENIFLTRSIGRGGITFRGLRGLVWAPK